MPLIQVKQGESPAWINMFKGINLASYTQTDLMKFPAACSSVHSGFRFYSP